MSTIFFITMAIIIIFLEIFNAIQCGFLGIILGNKMNNGKIGYSVLFGFITYLVSQSMILGLVFVYGLFDSSVMELFKTVKAHTKAPYEGLTVHEISNPVKELQEDKLIEKVEYSELDSFP